MGSVEQCTRCALALGWGHASVSADIRGPLRAGICFGGRTGIAFYLFAW